jgi:hypothetical protein
MLRATLTDASVSVSNANDMTIETNGEHLIAPSAARSRIPVPYTLDEMMSLAEIVMNSGLALGHRVRRQSLRDFWGS